MIKRLLGKRKISRLEFWIEIYHGWRCTSGLCRSENVGRRQHRIRNAFSAYDLRPTSHKFRITRGPTFFKKFLRIFVERQGFYISLTFLSVCCPFSRVTKSKRAHVTVRITRWLDWRSRRLFAVNRLTVVETPLETAGHHERESLSESLKVTRFHWSRTR